MHELLVSKNISHWKQKRDKPKENHFENQYNIEENQKTMYINDNVYGPIDRRQSNNRANTLKTRELHQGSEAGCFVKVATSWLAIYTRHNVYNQNNERNMERRDFKLYSSVKQIHHKQIKPQSKGKLIIEKLEVITFAKQLQM